MVAGSLEAAAAAVAGSLVEEAVAGNLVAVEAGPLAVRAVAGVGRSNYVTSGQHLKGTATVHKHLMILMLQPSMFFLYL